MTTPMTAPFTGSLRARGPRASLAGWTCTGQYVNRTVKVADTSWCAPGWPSHVPAQCANRTEKIATIYPEQLTARLPRATASPDRPNTLQQGRQDGADSMNRISHSISPDPDTRASRHHLAASQPDSQRRTMTGRT